MEHLLAHALAMEVEAVERYGALADQMGPHNNRDVAVLFRKLAEIEKLHVDNVNPDISEGHPAHIAPWNTPGKPRGPEAPSVSAEGLHYMMHPYRRRDGARGRAPRVDFYDRLVAQAEREDIRKLAAELCETEREHVTLLGLARPLQPPPRAGTGPDPPCCRVEGKSEA